MYHVFNQDAKTCCIMGYRGLPEEKKEYVKEKLCREIQNAIEEGYTRFLSGFSGATDLIFAEIVAQKKAENPNLRLEARIPFAGKLKSRDHSFHKLLKQCDRIVVVCENYVPSCYMRQNRCMIDESFKVITLYDGKNSAEAALTLECARQLQKDLQVISI